MKRTFGKRFRQLVGAVMATALVLSNVPPVGVITYADPVTVHSYKDPDDGRSGESDDITLLAGENNDLRGYDLASTITNYDNTFLLGIAADFCVFLQDYFHVMESDAEGRVAVGGDLIVDTPWSKPPSYNVGAGDYNTGTPLDMLLKDRLGSATVIIGGTDNGVLRNGQLSDGYYSDDYTDEDLHEADADHKSTRKLVMNYTAENLPSDWYVNDIYDDYTKQNSAENIPVKSGPGAYQKIDQTQTYVYPLLNFQNEFNKLVGRSSQLNSNSDSGTVYWDEDSKTLTFKYKDADTGNENEKVECVYFTLDDTTFEYFQQATTIKFVNIPTLPVTKDIVNNDGTDNTWDRSYIVVNVTATGVDNAHSEETGTSKAIYFTQDADDARDKETFINGKSIWEGPAGDVITRDVKNNHPGAASLLYNFYGADADTTIVLGSNFQGTVFAPLSHVTDWSTINNDEKHGHLSGALVARSFKGKTEFGYRPFTGGVKLAEASTDYRIAINKYDEDEENLPEEERTPLVGATFGIFAVDEDGNVAEKPVRTMTTTENQDFIELTSGRYVLREISAPEGYALSDEEYYFEVQDTDYTVKILKTPVAGKENEYTYDAFKVFTGTDEETGEVKYKKEVDEESGEILTVTLPRVEIDIYKDKERSEKIAGYTYSAFRADQRTYKINGHEVKFRFFDNQGSMLEGIGKMIIDGVEYDWNSNEFQEIYKKLTFVRTHGMSSNAFDEDKDNYYAYVVLYDNEPIFPVVTLTRVLVENEDNHFDGFNFFDAKAVVVNKVDENGKALTGADIRLENETYTVSGGSYSSTSEDVVEPVWKWDKSSSSTVKLKDIERISYDGITYTNIYRVTEDDAPEGYQLIDKDTVFIWFGDCIYINEEVPRDEALQYLPVYWDGSQLVENSEYEANGWTKKNITIPENRVIYIRNAKIEGAKLSLRKANQSGAFVSGASIALYRYDPSRSDEGGYIGELVEKWEPLTDEIDFAKDLRNSDSDYIKNGYLLPGTYYLVETQAPAGYKTDLVGEKLFFTVDKNFNITKGYADGGSVDVELEIEDDNEDWRKIKEKSPVEVKGATSFEIKFSASNGQFMMWPTTNISSFPNSWPGDINFAVNSDNKYIYTFDEPTDIKMDSISIQGSHMQIEYVRFYAGSGETIGADSALIIEGDENNGYTLSIPNEIDGYQVGVSKVDPSDEFLPGAEITLYSIDEETGKETKVESKTSVEGEPLIFNVEAGKKYVVRETKAPDGYTLSDKEYYFRITPEGVVEDVTVKEDYTPVIYNVENGDITQDEASDTTKYAPAEKAQSDGSKYVFSGWDSAGTGKYISQIDWNQSKNPVKSLMFIFDEGSREFDSWANWGDTAAIQPGQFNDSESQIVEIQVILTDTAVDPFDINIQFSGTSTTCTVDPSDGPVVTIFGGSAEPIKYYKILGTNKEQKPSTPAVWQSDIDGNEYWVEAEVHETKERFSASKITLNVYDDEEFTEPATYSVAYNDSLDVNNNTYNIDGYTYTFAVDETDGTISKITKNGTETADTSNRFKAVKVADGYVIVDNEGEEGKRILYPTLVNVDELLLTEGLPADIIKDGGVKIVDKPSEIQISKKDKDDEGNADATELSGAKLKLTLDKATKTTDATLKNVKVENYKSGTEPEKNKDYITWVSGDSPVKFTGLPDGKYTITEEASPDGYKKLTKSVTFVIENGIIVEINGKKVNTTDEESGEEIVLVDLIEVFNEKDTGEDTEVVLPETGGIGIPYWFYMGMCLIGLSVIVLSLNKREAQ